MFTALQVVGLKRVNLSLIGTEQIEQHHKGWMKKETYYEKDSLWDRVKVFEYWKSSTSGGHECVHQVLSPPAHQINTVFKQNVWATWWHYMKGQGVSKAIAVLVCGPSTSTSSLPQQISGKFGARWSPNSLRDIISRPRIPTLFGPSFGPLFYFKSTSPDHLTWEAIRYPNTVFSFLLISPFVSGKKLIWKAVLLHDLFPRGIQCPLV